MDFDKIFLATATASKQLEARWFFDEDKNGSVTKKSMHAMPFQRRNLSYWRGVQYKGKRRRKRAKASIVDEQPKKLDILYSQWKHRVRNYNDAFLSSPRRATRNFKPSKLDESVTQSRKARKELYDDDDNTTKEEEHLEEVNRVPSESVALLVSEIEDCEEHYRHGRSDKGTSMISDFDDSLSYILWSAKGQKLDPNYTRVVFHLLYIDPETSELSVQPEVSDDRRCPFCYFDGGTDVGLLMHCTTCHNRLSFKSARSEDGTLHIAVTKLRAPRRHTHDFCFVRARQSNNKEDLVPTVPFVKRQLSRAGALDLPTRRRKIKLLMEVGADEASMKQFERTSEVPVRQYFHSRSNEPMLEGEWDVDSDDEDDEVWLTKMSEELLDEFDDVTSSEKKFAKIWNRFMKSHTVIPDRIVPSKCSAFVRAFGQMLNKEGLRQEVLLHFTGFWDAGLISSNLLMELMTEFDSLAQSEENKVATTNGSAGSARTDAKPLAAIGDSL